MVSQWNAWIVGAVFTLCVASAGTARAQGYEVEAVRLQPSEGPESAVPVDGRAAVRLPFPLHLYGEPYDVVTVVELGAVLPGDVDPPQDERPPAWPPEPVARGAWDGMVAPAPDQELEDARYWFEGDAPDRRLVVEWRGSVGPRVQVRLHEGPGRIEFVHDVPVTTGGGNHTHTVSWVDERGGSRYAVPMLIGGTPDTDWRFHPRTVLFNVPDRFEEPVPVAWQDVRKESTVPDGCTKRCTYLARGKGFFHVPDRAVVHLDAEGRRRRHPRAFLDALAEEDAATFRRPDGTERGDSDRWVRQVLDGKVLFLPADGGEPLRVWFRIVEYFTLDARGIAGADYHTWNLRWTLSNVFSGDDPREEVDRWYAWRAEARGRLTVGKLFDADQTDDWGRQFDTGRVNEYHLWSGRLTHGVRPRLAPAQTPEDGWVRFRLVEDDEHVVQHADAGDLRFVPDPNYVDGHYGYVIRALDNPFGWVTGREVPAPPLRDEPFDVGIETADTPTTGR